MDRFSTQLGCGKLESQDKLEQEMPLSTQSSASSLKTTWSSKLVKVKSACLLLSKAEVAFAQVEEDGLAGLGQPFVQLVLGEARPQAG